MNVPGSLERTRTDRLRAIPLATVLRAVGARPDPHDKAKWHTARAVLSVTGAKFIDWTHAVGGGGAIDLAMHLNRQTFKNTLDWLAGLPRGAPSATPPAPAPNPRPLALPAPVTDTLPAVLSYLSGPRRLPLDALRQLIEAGDLYADHAANAVFRLRDEHRATVGAELRGTGSRSWRGMAPGSRKDRGAFAVGPTRPEAVVLCESAIDAISCRALYPNRRCLSTSGARPNPAWLPALLTRPWPLYCGFDADPVGDTMACAMIARYPAIQRLRPPQHDWNDTLRARP